MGKLLEETKFYETLKARREIIIGGQSVMEPDIQLFVIIETFWELTYSQFNPPENAQSSVGLVTLPRGDVSNTQYLTELMGELRNAQVAYPECLADWRLNSAVRQIALPLDRAIDLNKLLGRGGANKDQLANSGRILKKFEQLVETVIRFVENSCVRTIERLAYIYLASSFLDQEMEAIIYAN